MDYVGIIASACIWLALLLVISSDVLIYWREQRKAKQRGIDLQSLLAQAKNYKMTPEEQEAQRRSFVYGNCAIDNPKVTRELVNEVADSLSSDSKSL